ncbi:hypothetical protein TWF706_000742 [Orbilia oligospora]|nr:hypothetical protein TWF706_000742 [Orbilia oligospora]
MQDSRCMPIQALAHLIWSDIANHKADSILKSDLFHIINRCYIEIQSIHPALNPLELADSVEFSSIATQPTVHVEAYAGLLEPLDPHTPEYSCSGDADLAEVIDSSSEQDDEALELARLYDLHSEASDFLPDPHLVEDAGTFGTHISQISTPIDLIIPANSCILNSGLLSPISILEIASPQPTQQIEDDSQADQTSQQLAKRQTGYLRAIQELDDVPITRPHKHFNRNRHTKPKYEPPVAAKIQKKKAKKQNRKNSKRSKYILNR